MRSAARQACHQPHHRWCGMCGRIGQAREPVEYEKTMHWNPRNLGRVADGLRYNVPLGTEPMVMRQRGGVDAGYQLP